jgi:hypothetical protein
VHSGFQSLVLRDTEEQVCEENSLVLVKRGTERVLVLLRQLVDQI